MMNDELPVPPEMHVGQRRGYRPLFCCAYLALLTIVIIAIASISQLAGRPDPRDEQYDQLLVRFKKLEDSCATQVQLRAELANVEQHSDTKIADIKANVREMSATLSRKKRLVDVPLALMVDSATAHDMMMNGDIMRDEYRAFAAQQHNMDVGTMARQFLQSARSIVFNMHYVNRVYGVQLSQLYSIRDSNITFGGFVTTVRCRYLEMTRNRTEISPMTYAPSSFTDMFMLDIRCEYRPNMWTCHGPLGSALITHSTLIAQVC